VDAWLAKGADVNTKGKFIGPEAEPSMRIGSPGAATSAITVASFTTRNEWLLANGNREDVPLEVDTISNFSSDGPRRDDYPKPDVAAPGAMIISCRSSDYQPPSRWAIDSDYTICAGTSIACPFITGIAALLLGRQSKSSEGLDPADLKSILREHCVDAAGNLPGTFDRKWGYGLIDASEL
jgi:subtilisin family serine protease